LVRHAPVAVKGICYGQSDVPLSLSAEDAGDVVCDRWRRAAQGVPELWSSPSARARGIVEVLARRWNVDAHVDARLSELAFGAWEGRSFDEIERSDRVRFDRWMQSFEIEAPPGGETVDDLRRRFTAWLAERRASGRTVLAVTHAGVIRVARAHALGLRYGDVARQSVHHLRPERVPLVAC
jgi:alpha-ribazole phosphatase